MFRNRELTFRVCLVPVAVGICYLFQWNSLRSLTADLNLQLTSIFGVHWERLSPDLVAFHGRWYRYVVSCTMADAWFGAIPLVWKITSETLKNTAYLVGLGVFMFGLNIVRLTISMLLLSNGVPWLLGHQLVSALTYLVCWLVIQRRAAWA
jgi:hypothetical protein